MNWEIANVNEGFSPVSMGLLAFWAIANGEGIAHQLNAEFEKVARRGLKQLSLGIEAALAGDHWGGLFAVGVDFDSVFSDGAGGGTAAKFFLSQGLLVTRAGVNLWLVLQLLRS